MDVHRWGPIDVNRIAALSGGNWQHSLLIADTHLFAFPPPRPKKEVIRKPGGPGGKNRETSEKRCAYVCWGKREKHFFFPFPWFASLFFSSEPTSMVTVSGCSSQAYMCLGRMSFGPLLPCS